MGFYIRKSISCGPFRFNLSKSGVGLSVGVRGLRYGTGPKGNYIHMGRYGLYYRQFLHSGAKQPSANNEKPPTEAINLKAPSDLIEIESADVAQIRDSSSEELLSELNTKRKKMRIGPIVAAASIGLILIGLANTWPSWSTGLVFAIGAVAFNFARKRDQLNKTAILFYNLEEDMEKEYENFHNDMLSLASCARVWHIEASGHVQEKKYHAGASELVRRKKTFIQETEPPYVKTNISTIAIGVGRRTLHFFPDRVLVYDVNGVGAVSYCDLKLQAVKRKFIEDEPVPSDAQVLEHTWQYVNKNGGPDKRFKNNRQLPVCLYEELSFQSSTGLNELIQLSKVNVSESLIFAVNRLGSHLQKAQEHRS